MTLPGVWTKVTRAFKVRKTKNEIDVDCAENEIIFSKNNVCVHSHGQNHEVIHNSGYLSVSLERIERGQSFCDSNVTLRLSWTPNVILCNRYHKPEINQGSDASDDLSRKISVESCDSGYHNGSVDELDIDENYEYICSGNSISLIENILSTTEGSDDTFNYSYVGEKIPRGNESDKSDQRLTEDIIDSAKLTSNKSSNLIVTSPIHRKQDSNFTCKFIVDLGYVKSLRLFFNQDKDSGELVVTSTENQYKILHFHYGGLRKLSDVLERWKAFVSDVQNENSEDIQQLYKHFKICYSEVQKTELHPEETSLSPISLDGWLDMLNDDGQIEDGMLLRKRIFFGGLHEDIRKFIWPFLLNFYPFHSTYEQRSRIKQRRRRQYEEISEQRKILLANLPADHPFQIIDYLVHKDVIRTDRSHPFYAGDGNSNLILMERVLMNYILYDSKHNYMQGMSDILAPILIELPDEAEAFWCFVDIMRKELFVCTPTDSDMEKNLTFLRELIRLMHPRFHEHLQSIPDGMDLLFCHRWLLLCFKREFAQDAVLQLWEACWSNYLTDYFHLFICLAVITIYADYVIEERLKSDDMLYYFTSLAMNLNIDSILKKARGLVHLFRTLDKIPQTLAPLCERRGSDMWDCKHIPTIELQD